MTAKKRKTDTSASPPLTIHDSGEPAHAAMADAPDPAAALIGLTFVRASGAEVFMDTITIDISLLPFIRCGVNRFGPNGLNLISFKGQMFTYKGDFPGDGNPLHDPFIGFPVYVEVGV